MTQVHPTAYKLWICHTSNQRALLLHKLTLPNKAGGKMVIYGEVSKYTEYCKHDITLLTYQLHPRQIWHNEYLLAKILIGYINRMCVACGHLTKLSTMEEPASSIGHVTKVIKYSTYIGIMTR